VLIHGEAPQYSTLETDPSYLPIIREGMRLTVTGAIAQQLNFPYVAVAAKTGTAETGIRNQYDNSWVIGFFPYEEPRYAFAVVLERGPAGSGSQAVNAMRRTFEYLHADNSPYVGGTGTSTSLAL
jgi:penicillin-binding protein 2